MEEENLEKISETIHHQGVAALCFEKDVNVLDAEGFEQIQAQKNKNVLILDRISNSHNFGAVCRTAAFLGVQSVILSEDAQQSRLSPSAYRVSKGGIE